MKAKISFASLMPERPTFEDLDGALYEFRTGNDFGTSDMARAQKLQASMSDALDALKADEADEAAGANFELYAEALIELILPSLPAERRKAMTLWQKSQIADWWGKQMQPQAPAVKDAPGEA